MPKGNGDVIKKRVRKSVDLELHLPALSVNKMYTGVKRRSVYYKSFRGKVFKLLSQLDNYRCCVRLDGNLNFKMEIGFSNRASDLSNAVKAIEDILAEYYKFNDKQVVHIELDKYLVNKGDEYMKIYINKSRKNIDKRRKK